MIIQHKHSLLNILRLQLVVGVVGALALDVFGYFLFAASFFYGVVMMAINGWWLAIRLKKTNGLDVEAGQRSLYTGAAIRFVSLMVGLILAYAMGLHLLLVATGMFVAQMSMFISALVSFKREQE